MAALTAAVVVAVGIGGAAGTVAHGQTTAPRARESGPRTFQFVGGAGASWIGVSVRELGDEDAAKAKLTAPGGVLVDEVSRESPAETAGLKTGDVVVEFDGERVRSTRQFTRLVQETPAGRKVQAAVMRDGQRVPISIQPRESSGRFFDGFDQLPEIARRWMPPPPPAPPAPPSSPAPPAPPAPPSPPALHGFFDFDELVGRGTRLGVTVSDLQPQLAEYFGVKDGVLVTAVTAESTAAKAGVKAGDVITAVNGSAVTSPAELRQRTARLNDGEELSIGVVRDKKPVTLKGKVEGVRERRRTTTVL